MRISVYIEEQKKFFFSFSLLHRNFGVVQLVQSFWLATNHSRALPLTPSDVSFDPPHRLPNPSLNTVFRHLDVRVPFPIVGLVVVIPHYRILL